MFAHKYYKTAALAAAGYVGDSPLFLLDYLLRFARVAVLLAIWRIILQGKGPVSGMTLDAVLTYTLIAEVLAEQLACRTSLGWDLFTGAVATRFLRPMGMVGQYAAEALGRWSVGFCAFSIPLLLLSPLLGVCPGPASAAAGGLFLASLVLGISVGLALEFIFGAMVVAFESNVYVVDLVRSATSTLLSGALLPLALLPWSLGDVFAWLPFASVASAPLRVYTGTGSALPLMLGQAAWAGVLWPLALWLWRAQRERLALHGG